MAEPGTLIFRNNTCVKKVKEKIVSKKAPLGPPKKYVRPFSKYKAHISKYVRHIFGRLKTRMNKGFAELAKCRQKQSATKTRFRNPVCKPWIRVQKMTLKT